MLRYPFPPFWLSSFFRSGDSSRDVASDLFDVPYTGTLGRLVVPKVPEFCLRELSVDAA